MTDYYIGLMSGTSMDGIDAVLVELDGYQWRQATHHVFLSYENEYFQQQPLKEALLRLQYPQHNELQISQLIANHLAHLNAQAVRLLLAKSHVSANQIKAIGCHGQTIRHEPENHYSIQLINGALLSEETGITTVCDFRSRDIAAHGQGAPLTPIFHQMLFAHHHQTNIVLNLGGIANISILSPHQPLVGFDTGPANMLIDAWVQHIWKLPYDAHGQLASAGRILTPLLQQLANHHYFQQPFPKSTGRDLFSLKWLQSYLNGCEQPEDVLRTLVELSAQTIADAIKKNIPNVQTIYACGGGINNTLLMQQLSKRLPAVYLTTTLEKGLHPQHVEAAAFAWFAACWYNKIPVSIQNVTGAKHPSVLGCGYIHTNAPPINFINE